RTDLAARLRDRRGTRRARRRARGAHARRLRGDGRDDDHRVVRRGRRRRHGEPARCRRRRPADRPGGEPHHVLRAEDGGDHGVHLHGRGALDPPQRTLRRDGADGMMRRTYAAVARHPVLAFYLVFAVFPWVVPYKSLAAQVLIYGLFALGFNLLYGYTGLLSFGSAAYWGLGAYGTGIALAKLKVTSLWLALGMGLAAALVGGTLVGFFCLRRRGIYFAMLTLAFAPLLYFVGFHLASWTGGDDGLRGIAVPAIWLGGFTLRLDRSVVFYYFTLIVVGVAVAALKRILDSPFGTVLQAIRENADRAAACGYDIARIKHLSFVF